MNRVWMIVLATSVVGVGGVGVAAARPAQGGTVLYHPGRDIKEQGIDITAWGSGVISQTDEVAYEGTMSIRVSTRNFFQGGVLGFQHPIDVAEPFGDKGNLLRLTFKPADGSAAPVGGGPGGIPGGPRGPGSAGGGPGGPPGGFRGGPGGAPGGPGGGFPGGFPPGFGQGGGGRAPGGLAGAGGGPMGGGAAEAPKLKTLRFIISTSDGKKSEAYVPVNLSAPADRGWLNVAVPLQAIQGLDRTNKVISGFAVSGDATTTFYIGDLRVISDMTPVRADTNVHDLNLALGEEVSFIGYGEAGSSIVRYSWDFDDSDGIQVDSEGQSVKRKFRKAGTYNVTLTVSDFYGLKTGTKVITHLGHRLIIQH